MEHDLEQNEVKNIVRSLCPDADERTLREAEDNLKDYLRVVLRIHERLQWETRANVESPPLTDSQMADRIKDER